MFRKNYLILLLFLLLLLSNCQPLPYGGGTAYDQYNQFQVKHSRWPQPYFTLACSKSDLGGVKNTCYMGSGKTREQANAFVMNNCSQTSSDCVVVKENDKLVYSQQQNKIDNYIAQCEYIGFKRNTEKMGECVLKISQTETQIVNNKSGSDNTLVNLLILQESLKVLNPPVQPNRNIRCNYNTVGGIGSVNCF